MTIKYCDKCGKTHTKLIQLKEEYGDYELCDPCFKEIDKKITTFHSDWLAQMKGHKIALFNGWMGAKDDKKKSWLTSLTSLFSRS